MKKVISIIIILFVLPALILLNKSNEKILTSSKNDYQLNTNLIAVYLKDDKEYVSSSKVPSKTDGYRFSHSECKDNTTITWNNSLWAAEIENMNNGEISCKLYFDKENSPAKDYILSHINTIDKRSNFSTALTNSTTGIIYEANDDYGTSYYFAGAPTDNYLQFAGFWWRIVRINGDNTIRLIYAGSIYDYQVGLPNGYDDSSTLYQTIGSYKYNTATNGQRFVGFYHSSNNLHGNATSSNISSKLNEWYKNNLSNYDSYISNNTSFCNGRIAYKDKNGTSEALYSENPLYFEGYVRIQTKSTPSFKCANSSDMFTSSINDNYGIIGNGALQNPIGLITADEVAYAGGVYNTSNGNYYLYTNTVAWTMTPAKFETNSPRTWQIGAPGGLNYNNGLVTDNRETRPVINLKADVELTGSGTASDPYVVKGTKPEGKALKDQILATATTKLTRTDFTKTISDTSSGTIYYDNDNDGITYYFAGAPTDNWIKFAGYYWRIIRINGNGSIRIIYQGTTANTTGNKTLINNGASQIFNENYNMSSFVGLKYVRNQQHGTATNSTILTKLENWYSSNNLINYIDKLDSSVGFCSDREMASGYSWSTNPSSTIYYAAYDRVAKNQNNVGPSFKCSSNDVLKIPVGLITIDEATFAGLSNFNLNTNNYLSVSINYWTMSPYLFNGSNAGVFYIGTEGSYGWTAVNYGWGVRPVINLRSDIKYFGGSGTASDPYVVN